MSKEIKVEIENDEEINELREEIKDGDEETREDLEEHIDEVKEDLEEQHEEIIEQVNETKEEVKTWLENALNPIAAAITSLATLTAENQARISKLETETTPDPLTPPPSMTDTSETEMETSSITPAESPEKSADESPDMVEETQVILNRAGREVIRL